MALPRVNLDQGIAAEAVRQHTIQIDNVVRTATAQLVRRSQATMGEVIQREGITPAALASQGIRCAFGYNAGENDGCTEIVKDVCGTCNAMCCEFHMDHEHHKDVVHESTILRQQQALAQQKLSMRTPAVAPAKDSTSVETSGSEKKARKNTWDDLKSRYQKIKGQAYEKTPGQKRGDFQLMVEGLEARDQGGRVQEPSQAKERGGRVQEAVQAKEDAWPSISIGQASTVQQATLDPIFQQYQQFQQFQAYLNFSSNAFNLPHFTSQAKSVQGSTNNGSNINDLHGGSSDDEAAEHFV